MTAAPPRPAPLPDLTGPTGQFYRWLAAGELRVQRCAGCGRLRHVPRILCPQCGAERADWVRCSGDGLLFSWTTTHRPLHPAFTDTPLTIGVVTLAEGPRLVAPLLDVPPERLAVGLPLQLDIRPVDQDLALPAFRAVTAPFNRKALT